MTITGSSAPMEPDRPALLLVDDEESVRFALKTAFSREFTIHQAQNSEEALAVIGRHRIDVAVVDINMAKESGLDLLPRIKEADEFIEVIMLTGFQTVTSMQTAWERKAFAFLTKPFNIAEVGQKLREAVGLREESLMVQSALQRTKIADLDLYEIQAGLIHDLNNLLTVPIGYASMAVQSLGTAGPIDLATLDQARQNLATIEKTLANCQSLCARHLRILRSVTDPKTKGDTTSVRDLATNLLSSLRGHNELRLTQLKVQLADVLPHAKIDAADLMQILLNLLINAAQSTPQKHEVVFSARPTTNRLPSDTLRDSPARRVVGLKGFRNEGTLLAITVSDNGTGITPETMLKLFSQQTTTKPGATASGSPTWRRSWSGTTRS